MRKLSVMWQPSSPRVRASVRSHLRHHGNDGRDQCPDQATLTGPWDRLGKKRKRTAGGGFGGGWDGRES